MKTDEYLKILKEDYKNTQPAMHLKLHGADELFEKISSEKDRTFLIRFAFATVAIFLTVLTYFGISKIAKAQKSDSFFYTLKQVSQEVINKVKNETPAPLPLIIRSDQQSDYSENESPEEIKGESTETSEEDQIKETSSPEMQEEESDEEIKSTEEPSSTLEPEEQEED